VHWDAYLDALRDVGYHGFLTVEHEIRNGAQEIYDAVAFLKEKIRKYQ